MQAAFVITLDLTETEPSDSAETAQSLLEILQDAGVPVVSVNPWNSPGSATTTLADVARAAHAQLSPQLPQ